MLDSKAKSHLSIKGFVKNSTKIAIRALGWLLVLFFLCLLAMMTYSFVYDICGSYYSIKNQNMVLLVVSKHLED